MGAVLDKEQFQLALIEPTRLLMYKASEEFGFQSEEVLRLSKILDELINLYQSLR